jgi:hypothetical protein
MIFSKDFIVYMKLIISDILKKNKLVDDSNEIDNFFKIYYDCIFIDSLFVIFIDKNNKHVNWIDVYSNLKMPPNNERFICISVLYIYRKYIINSVLN